jgi:hypothetical protein
MAPRISDPKKNLGKYLKEMIDFQKQNGSKILELLADAEKIISENKKIDLSLEGRNLLLAKIKAIEIFKAEHLIYS